MCNKEVFPKTTLKLKIKTIRYLVEKVPKKRPFFDYLNFRALMFFYKTGNCSLRLSNVWATA